MAKAKPKPRRKPNHFWAGVRKSIKERDVRTRRVMLDGPPLAS
jgi:hypothetical protein